MATRTTRLMLGFGVALLLQGLAAVLLGSSAEYLHKSQFHGLLAPIWSGCMAIATGLFAVCSGKTPYHKWLRHWAHALSFVTCLVAIAALVIGIMGVVATCSGAVNNRLPTNLCRERKSLHVAALCLAIGTLVAAAALFITCCTYYVTCPSCCITCPSCDVTCPTCDVTCPTCDVTCFTCKGLCDCCRSWKKRRQKAPPVGAPLPSQRDTGGEEAVQEEMFEHAHENPYVYPDDPPPYYIPDVQVEIDQFEMSEMSNQELKKTVQEVDQLEISDKEVKKTVRFVDQDPGTT
ncbi:PREDICTED: uncharacterized protein LOC109487769 [Branchiostoma belcheri]|uniref:Uncharacterized protein LOC109487769 n=1 Tax=Branchiostoma belcheri TaxID=7741 RepID=A0A6P5AMG3_BRABE|nr:PREDICTED: uncharacterized protein LOC109487769 [Branchiostoma belcheri]